MGEENELSPIILANSNGTLIRNVSSLSANFGDLEQLKSGIHEELKRDKRKFFLEGSFCSKIFSQWKILQHIPDV